MPSESTLSGIDRRRSHAGLLFDHRTDPRVRHLDAHAALLRGRGTDPACPARPHAPVPAVRPPSHPPDHAGKTPRLLDQRDPRDHPDVQGTAGRGGAVEADDQAHRGKARGSSPEAPRHRGDVVRTGSCGRSLRRASGRARRQHRTPHRAASAGRCNATPAITKAMPKTSRAVGTCARTTSATIVAVAGSSASSNAKVARGSRDMASWSHT